MALDQTTPGGRYKNAAGQLVNAEGKPLGKASAEPAVAPTAPEVAAEVVAPEPTGDSETPPVVEEEKKAPGLGRRH